MKIQVNSCICKADRMGMKVSGKSCATVTQELCGRHAFGKFSGTVTLKVTAEAVDAALRWNVR